MLFGVCISGRMKRSSRFKQLSAVSGLLVVSWLGVVLPLASILICPAIVVAIVLALRWRKIVPLVVIVLSPISIGFVHGLVEWFSEKPKFQYMGLPGYEFYNLDPTSRCYRSSGGCVVHGGEWAFQSPHNAGLRLMTNLLGPPRRTYRGPYPSKEEAVKLTDSAAETSPEMFLKDTVLINGRPFALKPKTAEVLINDFGLIFLDVDLPDFTRKVRAQILDNSCLLIRVTVKEKTPDALESDGIVLFDLSNLSAFARYVVAGERGQRIPRLLVE